MTNKTYALLVGINNYHAPDIPNLQGCLTDIGRFAHWLTGKAGDTLSMAQLTDSQATRATLISTFRAHLGQAKAGDTAIFYFSGHGSREPVAPEHEHLEPTGYNQTLVCYDSRTAGTTDLVDKELSILIDGVAATGAHVLVILDCCHAGGATRSPHGEVQFRSIPPAPCVRAVPDQRRGTDTAAAPGHIALSACRSFERARELQTPSGAYGVFSDALLASLTRANPATTYRELITAVRCQIENLSNAQHPVLYPLHTGGIADQAILGGHASSGPAGFVLRHGARGWEIDAGSCHGIATAINGETTEFDVLQRLHGQTTVIGKIGIDQPGATRSQVRWLSSPIPREDRAYPVSISHMPQLQAGLRLHGPAQLTLLLANAVAPSPYIRVLAERESHVGLLLSIRADQVENDVRFSACYPDGSPIGLQVRASPLEATERMRAMLEHVVRWHRIKDLAHPLSPLNCCLSLEVLQCRQTVHGTMGAPEPVSVSDTGEILLAYTYVEGQGWLPPRIRVRVRCAESAPYSRLYIALLNLTDSYAIESTLLPGDWIAPGGIASAFEGREFNVQPPPDRPIPANAVVKDWLKLIIATDDFNVHGLELPRLSDAPECERGTTNADKIPLEWGTLTLPLVTAVPAPGATI